MSDKSLLSHHNDFTVITIKHDFEYRYAKLNILNLFDNEGCLVKRIVPLKKRLQYESKYI